LSEELTFVKSWQEAKGVHVLKVSPGTTWLTNRRWHPGRKERWGTQQTGFTPEELL